MFTRPKPGETEEDILAMQEAFLTEKEKNTDFAPSAKVVNLRKHKVEESQDAPKKSEYAKSKGIKKRLKVTFSEQALENVVENESDITNDEELKDDQVYYPSIIPSVLGDIVEKSFDSIDSTSQKNLVFATSGFPTPRKRDKNITGGSKSIFSQQMKNSSKMEVDAPSTSTISTANSSNGDGGNVTQRFFDQSVILQGTDATDIHNENKTLLENMTEQEILQEKEKLAVMVDPALLQYIKSLRKNHENKMNSKASPKVSIMKNEPMNQADEPMGDSVKEIFLNNEKLKKEAVDVELLKDLSDNDVISHPKLQNWVHFDMLERDKLEWIKSMEIVQNKIVDKPYEARFDFKGYLLPYTMDYTEETKILFHHGQESHRPGYSFNELFQLCRSVVTQQRSLALNTLAGILEYNSIGIYDDIIDVPITKIYFVLRFALDENISIILEPTLKALRNMIYNRVDETCLDFLLSSEKGLVQPRLVSKKCVKEETDSETSELKDFHLVDLDLITGAIRTDILVRLRYILTTVKPPFVCVEYCLQILTRIARDSVENAENLCQLEGLLEFISENYIPKFISNTLLQTNANHLKLILDALKFVRVIVSQSKNNAALYCTKYNIFEALSNYIGNVVVENTLLLKIQIETFYLWSSLLWYNLGLNELSSVKCLLLKVLDNLVKSAEFSVTYPVIMHSHTAALITLLTSVKFVESKIHTPNFEFSKSFDDILFFAVQKWTSQLCNINSYTAGHLKSISALLSYASLMFSFDDNKKLDIKNHLLKMIGSEGFKKIALNLRKSSNLLFSISVSKKQMLSNLPNLNGSMIKDFQNLPPTLTAVSPIGFISSVSKYILISKDKDLSLSLLRHPDILDYIKKISAANQLNLSENWFSKVELDMLCHIACLSTNIEFSDIEKEIMYNFAFKLTYILSPEHKSDLEFILKHIVFNKNCFSTARLLKNLNISETNEILDNLDAILECYISILKLNSTEEPQCLVVSHWDQKILPRDWMFMPVLGLYTKSQELENSNLPKCLIKAKDDLIKHVVTCSLKWILVSELYFPEITNEIGLTDRFCRLLCVFLCDNSVFLDETVKPLLRKCVKIIFDVENSLFAKNKLNFDKNLLGINNFQDFYTQMVDQFQAVSYGDPTFSACILVPLAQKHNVKWRKIVWSEYAACLRALDCPKELLCYKLEEYLQPPELDFSLLKCYHRALNSNLLRHETIPYQIAYKHVEYAKYRQRSKAAQNMETK